MYILSVIMLYIIGWMLFVLFCGLVDDKYKAEDGAWMILFWIPGSAIAIGWIIGLGLSFIAQKIIDSSLKIKNR